MAKLNVELDATLHADLQALAERLDRPAAGIVAEAIRDYVAHEKAMIVAIEEGLAAADAGDLVDHADVVAEIKRLQAARGR